MEPGPRTECTSLCGSDSGSRRSSFAVFPPSSEARTSKHSLSLLYANSLPPTPREGQGLGSLHWIGRSGPSCPEPGQVGKRSWSSSSRTQSSAGTALVFGCTGGSFRGPVLDDLRFRSKCRPSFVDSRTRMIGAPERSEQNSRSSAFGSALPPSLDISPSETRTATSANDGRHSFAITVTASPRWTSSSFPPFDSDCYTLGLRSATEEGKSSTLA